MTPLTIEYSGTEKWVGAIAGQPSWGFANPVLNLKSRAPSTFTVHQPGADPAAAPVIPADGQIIVRKDRVYSGGFSGGTIIFRGRLTALDDLADPAAPGISMVFSDAWYDLQTTPFQHYWNNRSTGAGSVSTAYYSRIYLFQDISAGPGTPWSYLTSDQQIGQIIDFAQTICGIAIQKGTIDPVFNQPVYAVKSITCADALIYCLRPVPDAVTYFDYTTTPPTLHIRQRANLTAVNLPWADGVKHKSSRIKPRYDLQVSQVVLQYQAVNTVNGASYISFATDVYPAMSTGTARRSLVCPIDLRGGTRTTVYGKVTAVAIDPTLTSFWQGKKPDLNEKDNSGNALISSLAVDGSSISVIAEDGTDLTSSWAASWPNELEPGSGVATWMYSGSTQIVVKKVTITARVSYTRQVSHANSGTMDKVEVHTVSVKVRLTNSAAGTVTYSALQHSDPGDPLPTGLAQAIYNATNPLQWEGTHTIVEDNVSAIIGPGNVLNLTGGNAAWSTMNAQIFDVAIDFFNGRTVIEFGPTRHLTPAEYYEIINFYRARVIYDNPNIRNTGQESSGAASVNLPEDNHKENTTEGTPQQSIHTIISPPDGSSNQVQIQHDATNGQILQNKVGSTGTPVSGYPTSTIKLGDIGASTNKDAKYRKVVLRQDDGSGGFVHKYGWVLCTDGEGSDLGGDGGATISAYTIVSMHDDYYVCAPVGGGSNVNVAKPTKLRNSITSETFDGDTFSYDYSNSGTYTAALGDQNAQYVNRLATWNSGANNEHQDITPRYLSGDTIYAITVSGGTGVTVSSVAVTLLDINVDGRAWTAATY